MLILLQRPQHKSTSDHVGAPKNNQFGAIFIECGDIKKCCTFSGLEVVPKCRKKRIDALSCMHKGPKCIETLWDYQKKIPFVKNYKECLICAILTEKKPHFGAFPQAKKRCCPCSAALKIPPRCPLKMQILRGYKKKRLFSRKFAIFSVRWKFQF